MQNTLKAIEAFIKGLVKVVMTLVIVIFGGLMGLYMIFQYTEKREANQSCERDFGEGWRAITPPGDVYGAICKGPSNEVRRSRPSYSGSYWE